MVEKKPMTKTQLVAHLAEQVCVTKKQAGEMLAALVETAYKQEARVHNSGPGQAGRGQAQGAPGPQPGHRRPDQDPGQDRGQVPRGQSLQGCGRSAKIM